MKAQEDQEWFLGSVDFDVTKEQFTRLRPVARSGSSGSCWEQNDRELRDAFPSRNLACWFSAPVGLQKHELVEFQVVAIPGFDGNKKPDKFQVSHWQPAVEVLEAPISDEDRLREALKSEGVILKRSPFGRTIFQLSKECWLGPFDLVVRPGGRWGLPTEMKFDAVPWFDVLPKPVGEVRIDGARRAIVLTRGVSLVAPQFRNWMSDAEVLRTMLKRLHKFDAAAFNSVGLTYKALETYVIAAGNASLLPEQKMREYALVERVERLRHDLPLAMELVDEIVNALVGLGAVKRRIDARLTELGQTRKAEIDAMIAAETQELKRLQSETANARKEHDTLANQLAAKRKAAERDFAATDTAMQEKLRQLREVPARTVAELLASSSIFSALLPSSTTQISSGIGSRLHVVAAEGLLLEDGPLVAGALAAGLLSGGVDPSAAVPLLAAFSSGMLPIVGGEAANEALRAVGNCLCSGRAWSVPISPATVSLADVLAPSLTGLAGLREILETAQAHPDELFLAILEGINLGASDSYLPTLLDLPSRKSLLSFGGNKPRSWPDNLMLAATVSSSRHALPLPSQTWERAPLFRFSWFGATTSPLQAVQLSRVAMPKWRAWRETNSETPVVPQQYVPSPPAWRMAARLYSAIRALQPTAAGEASILAHVLAPSYASTRRELPRDFPISARPYHEFAKALISDNDQAN